MFIALTGPTGIGKTTVSQKIAERMNPSVSIDLDRIKHLVVKGFIYNDSEAGKQQWRLLGRNAAGLIKNFLDENYTVVVNGMVGEETWEEIFKINTADLKILLTAEENLNIGRDANRNDKTKMGEGAVKGHRNYFDSDGQLFFREFRVINTSEHSPEETAEHILSLTKK